MLRTSQISRNTYETQIELELTLEGQGNKKLNTPVPFFQHMLEQLVRFSQVDLNLTVKGDIEIDDHHTVEDIGIVLGQALLEVLGDKKGITRFAHSYAPLDESLSRVVIDLSGRSGLYFNADFTRDKIGNFDTQMVREFFQALVNSGKFTLHIDNIKGINAHHQIESIFKAFGLALKNAIKIEQHLANQIPSTKGSL